MVYSVRLDAFEKEEEAHQAFFVLMQEARKCRALFEAAGVPLPARLGRFLGEATASVPPVLQGRLIIPQPPIPPKPADWRDGWIWIPVKEATEATLVRCILRSASGPMSGKDVAVEMQEIREEAVNVGSVFNIGARLADKEISRTDDGWRLIDTKAPPVLHNGYVWGPPEVFEKQEFASHRRLLILHVLGMQTDGLQLLQLTRQLEQLPWVPSPKTKDLIKMDLRVLSKQGTVRKGGGHAGKWSAVATAKQNM